MKKFTPLMLAALTLLAACKKSSITPDQNTNGGNNITKLAPDGFNFATTKNVTVSLSLKAPNGDALKGVVVSLYNPANTNGNAAIYKGVTDASGNLVAAVTIPATVKQLVIDPAYVGLMRNAVANINGSSVSATIGGPSVFGGDIVPQAIVEQSGSSSSTLTTLASGITFVYPSPYTSSSDAIVNTSQTPFNLGVPKFLLPNDDVISASLLSYVNASLPEYKPVPDTHPEYLSSKVTSTLNVVEKSDVWITFVAEGAGNLNTLGFYTYKTGSAPTSESDIDKVTIILPNASGAGSGGGLKSGNKVKLGTFDPGTSIGFVLIGNGWTGKGVATGNTKFYSDDKLNPETNSALKKHTVVLYDDVNKVTLVGFEDLNRQTGSDNDFNDLVFYASSNPITGISNVGVPVVDKGGDADGDGVADELDAFPNDASKAYVSYYPSASGYANIAFEDNWPTKGDYDLNDVVVKYRYTFESNAQNKVVTIKGDYNVTAVGASFKNGFGVQFPFAASNVASVTGQKFKDNYISLAGNGVEAGQSKAVIIPFDNTDLMLNNPDNGYFVNVLNSRDKVTNGATATVVMTLSTPVAQSTITGASINSFLISNSRRTHEVHLPGYAPTDKADAKLLGQGDDNSIPSSSRYYLTKDNWPWAISFADNFTYPLEQVKITDAYPHFADWASSGGSLFPDWYTNTGSGYRVNSNLYTK
ncbi:LruC domain-containing protein [Mucilaginibacter auburnensis]|uniref:LruC domain-containing protein n=1 Tax=Mucilaginibacter auburnensis TaxID=1457233 RepID=A0A2H9VQI5_9SPHI|nr:LruC domain-containing protein [Mucilaginibacter auburnensis]PJJ83038.1 LruC domain-containing protein [Mucilaginibacter auburnensis]